MDQIQATRPGPVLSPEWRVSAVQVDYLAAIKAMEDRVAAIREGAGGPGDARELVWLL
ncbi:MAG: hypothetical protein JNM30_06265, partial [Rhodospirillales bacterium]|nr:hypothetical protein [Rhodospirillales bacterium]